MAGRGQITKRTTQDGRVRYLARVWHRRKSMARTFESKRLAQLWLAKQVQEIESRGLVNVSQQRFDAYLREWVEVWCSHLRPLVRQEYREMLERYAIPKLGDIALSRLRPADFQRLYNEMTADGRRRRSAQYLHAVLKLALDRALTEGKLASSPLASVPRPKAPHQRERVVLSEADASRFLVAIESHRHRALWTLELLHALRPGEALALNWGDVDLSAGVVHIRHTLAEDGARLSPKTESGVRSIVLSRAARTALATLALASGARDADRLVFTTSTGGHEHPRNVRRRFLVLCAKLELPLMTMYELRHSCASLLLSRGESIAAVSQMLGHRSPKTTLQFYARALPKDGKRLADAMDLLLPSSAVAPAREGTL